MKKKFRENLEIIKFVVLLHSRFGSHGASEEGRKVHKKFLVVEDMEGIGNGLQKARDSYEKAFNKLQTGNGNLISKTQKLKELGAKATKSLPAN